MANNDNRETVPPMEPTISQKEMDDNLWRCDCNNRQHSTNILLHSSGCGYIEWHRKTTEKREG